MDSTQAGQPSSHLNTQDARLALLTTSSTINLPERTIDEWDVADTAQRLIELGSEARENMTPEEFSESNARIAAVWAQHEERALARFRALQAQTDSAANHGSANVRSRPVDIQFGSDGNQYNPYAPHTSEEYMLQEIEAGRMDPEIMAMSRQQSNPAQSSLPGKPSGPPLAQTHASGHVSWMTPSHYSQAPHDSEQHSDSENPHEAPWYQPPNIDGELPEELSDVDCPDICPDLLAYPGIEEPQAGPHSQPITVPGPILNDQESLFGTRGPLYGPPYSPLDRPHSNESSDLTISRQLTSASTGRQRKRLAKPSLVVKITTPITSKSSSASPSPRKGRIAASSSSDLASAAPVTQNPRSLNIRSQGSTDVSSASARTHAGWEPQSARKLARRVEAVQTPQRKRRRDAVSPQDIGTETGTLTAGLPQGQ